MMNEKYFARQLALLRRETGMTQEELASSLHVTAQAVSKWENGHSLPETALLPELARLLDVGVDALFQDGNLMVLEAVFGDGLEGVNVTKRLNRFVQKERLSLPVSSSLLDVAPVKGRVSFLTVKYRTEKGVCYRAVPEGEPLELTADDMPQKLSEKGLSIIAGRYGTKRYHYDVMHKILHYQPFGWNAYRADHEIFPSDPANDETDYLTLIYVNRAGIHAATCAEGESLAYSEDETQLIRVRAENQCFIPDVIPLPSFGEGMECSWAAALTAALQSMGHETDYDEVMGVSGACYRLAFSSPVWDYSSVDGLVAYDHQTPAFTAFGYTPEMHGRIEKGDRARHRERICKEIRRRTPVLAINLRVAPEWGVICGYGSNGEDLFCRTKYDIKTIKNDAVFMKGFPPFDPATRKNPYGYLYVDNWPFLLCYFTGKRQAPAKNENVIQSLKVFIDCMQKEQERGYYTGFRAYQVWCRDLREDAFDRADGETTLARRFSVNQFCVLSLMDARRAAYRYLEKASERLKDENLREIAEIFRTSHEISKEIFRLTGDNKELSEKEVQTFWTGEKRNTQAGLLGRMADLEKEAHALASGWIAIQEKADLAADLST